MTAINFHNYCMLIIISMGTHITKNIICACLFINHCANVSLYRARLA